MKFFYKLFASALIAASITNTSSVSFAQDFNGVVDLAQNENKDYVSIDIDGNYDDWSDKPHSRIQYEWDTGNKYHKGALFRDKEYVYLHIKMSENSYIKFNGYNYRFRVDAEDKYVAVVTPNEEQISEGNNRVIVRSQNGYTLINGAEGVVTRPEGESDEWEVKIPLDFFSSDPETIKQISFYCSNLGPQELVATGTPTLPFVVAGTGALVASVALFKKRKDKMK